MARRWGNFRSDKVPILRSSQLLQFPRFSNSLGPSCPSRPPCFPLRRGPRPLGSPRNHPPARAVARPLHPVPQTSAACAPGRADPGSYLAAALGLRAPQAGALQPGAHGRRRLAGSARRGTEGERELGPRAHPATHDGGGGESRREGGRAPVSEEASERASEASSARDSPRSLPSSSPLRSFFFSPGARGPAHLTCGRL